MEIFANQQSSLADKLQVAIAQIQTQSNKKNDCKHSGMEFGVFEATGNRKQNLEKLFQALNSVPPASAEAEKGLFSRWLIHHKPEIKTQ